MNVSIHAKHSRTTSPETGYASPLADCPPEGGDFKPMSVLDEWQEAQRLLQEIGAKSSLGRQWVIATMLHLAAPGEAVARQALAYELTRSGFPIPAMSLYQTLNRMARQKLLVKQATHLFSLSAAMASRVLEMRSRGCPPLHETSA